MAAAETLFWSRDMRRGDTRYRVEPHSRNLVYITNLTTGRARLISKDVFERRYIPGRGLVLDTGNRLCYDLVRTYANLRPTG